MLENINFLSQQQKKHAKRERGDRLAFVVITITGIVFALIYTGIFMWKVDLDKQIENELNKQANLKREIEQASGEEKKYLSFYEKLKKITLLNQKRTHGTKSLIDTYLYFTSENTAVLNSMYDYYSKSIELTLSANSVFALAELIDLIHNEDFRSQYQLVEMTTLTRTSAGYYRLDVTLTM